jgi:hypothetical protein
MDRDLSQGDLEYGGPSPSSLHSSYSISESLLPCTERDLMDVVWTVRSFSDTGLIGGSSIPDVVGSPQSMYVSESVIEEKVSQGE